MKVEQTIKRTMYTNNGTYKVELKQLQENETTDKQCINVGGVLFVVVASKKIEQTSIRCMKNILKECNNKI